LAPRLFDMHCIVQVGRVRCLKF